MANIKSIVKSVNVVLGVVRFPSRYAAREFMEFAISEDILPSCARYRILSACFGVYYTVYLPAHGCLLDNVHLLCVRERLQKRPWNH